MKNSYSSHAGSSCEPTVSLLFNAALSAETLDFSLVTLPLNKEIIFQAQRAAKVWDVEGSSYSIEYFCGQPVFHTSMGVD